MTMLSWNPPLGLAVIALATVQVFKFLTPLFMERRLDFRRLTSAGGMPSSHAAAVVALATGVGIEEGWNSPLFSVAAFFSLVVMFDAAGVRRAAGLQAGVLNRMLDDLRQHHAIEGEKLKELIGHTPMQVFVGAAYGAALAFALHP